MQQNTLQKKIWPVLLLLLIIFLIVSTIFLHQKLNLKFLLGFLTLNIIIFSYLFKLFNDKVSLIQSQIQYNEEEINIINVESQKSREYGEALSFKITRYNNLEKVLEDLNRSLKLDVVINVLSSTVYSLISNSCGTALLYLVDNQYQKLNLVHSIKDDSDLVILSKEGDIFDQWVLRHSSQLIVENLKNDFRFDLDSARAKDMREVLSLISSPLISHNSLLGLLRLENRKTNFFNQDDLRFLSLVGELGAVALENSLLFQKTQSLAIHDDLTGLFTKQYFIGRLKDEAKRCARLDQHLSLLMIDIDFFKQYNDKFGHTAGDIVLKKVGALLKNNLGDSNALLCRFGGEEFLVMLSGSNKQKSLEIAEDLRKRIEIENIILRRHDTHITVSIGVASIPIDTKDDDELIQKADKAMYNAKTKGRNKVCSI